MSQKIELFLTFVDLKGIHNLCHMKVFLFKDSICFLVKNYVVHFKFDIIYGLHLTIANQAEIHRNIFRVKYQYQIFKKSTELFWR
jgi:hypothetical protein